MLGRALGLPAAVEDISRALTDLPAWAQLDRRYLAPGGRVVANAGKSAWRAAAEEAAAGARPRVVSLCA